MMKTWIIVAMVFGLMIVAGVVLSATNFVGADEVETVQKPIEYSSCGNSCTQESNCGLSSCGAVAGKSCGCKG